jgi:hypothetical protein
LKLLVLSKAQAHTSSWFVLGLGMLRIASASEGKKTLCTRVEFHWFVSSTIKSATSWTGQSGTLHIGRIVWVPSIQRSCQISEVVPSPILLINPFFKTLLPLIISLLVGDALFG